ncbi:MAG: outer membrane protein assembly factor BamD [Desulfobacterales bacterium]|jgi:outer membrane protein assembly factor BamD|nr:outer membrane protein assembly factor BamD [Desulfobacterales bacterium]
MTKRLMALCLTSLLVFTGCGSSQPKPEERTAAELYDEGIAELESGGYQLSIELFTKIKDWYPFSKHAVTADLKIADAHFGLQAYDEAAMAYENFASLHPRNEAVPYAIYRIGNCYLEQVNGIDQDQTYAKKAHDSFQRLLNQFPDSEYKHPAEAAIKICRKSIIANEIYVAKYYLKMKNYKAALIRFKDALNMYPDIGAQFDALGYIASCETALAQAKSEGTPAEASPEAPQTN